MSRQAFRNYYNLQKKQAQAQVGGSHTAWPSYSGRNRRYSR